MPKEDWSKVGTPIDHSFMVTSFIDCIWMSCLNDPILGKYENGIDISGYDGPPSTR